ncbi:hypothetical protein BKA65DRAFT_85390 [Rhexocercosporidium sp. MPI-PUGE-AT-0058]|nr:hypothetical protein BKA65DRAFT_85390 [Rhexocercosporidium sp. MPI-PUGE-AT-0058]
MEPVKCAICDKINAQICAVCTSSAYCSKACQAIDWPLHKTLCKKLSKLLESSPRPQTPAKLGILLSADSPEPRLVWVPYRQAPKPNLSNTHDEVIIHHLLDDPIPQSVGSFNIARNKVRGYTLDHTVVLYARDNWLNDGSKPNQAALALTNWELPYDWRGNILVMSYKGLVSKNIPSQTDSTAPIVLSATQVGGETEPYQDFQDVSLVDFRTAVDYLSLYGMAVKPRDERSHITHTAKDDDPVSEQQELTDEAENQKSRKVKGVLIRCEGDIGVNKKQTGRWERYSEVEVPKYHAIWDSQPTGASKIMGLPLLVHKQPPNPAWNPNDHTRFDNQPATFLNLTVDPKNSDLWGFAPPEWQSEVGSVILVRKDQKDLSREQAWTLAEFMQFEVSDSFEDAMESDEEGQRRAAVLKMLNWKKFDDFLEKFKVEMTSSNGRCWDSVKSPFGMMEGCEE